MMRTYVRKVVAMAQKNKVLEDLRIVFAAPYIKGSAQDTLDALKNLFDGLEGSKEVYGLSPEDQRLIHGFRLSLHRFETLTPEMMQRHVLAQWRGVKPAALRLSIGKRAETFIKQLDRIKL